MKKLGQREYLPVAQATKRLGSTVGDMVHAAGQRQIQLCINLFQIVEEACSHRIPMPDESLIDEMLHMGYRDEPIDIEELSAQKAFWGRTTMKMPHGIYELFYDDARRLEMSATNSICITEAVRFDGEHWWISEFRTSVEVALENLVIRTEELNKFRDGCTVVNSDDLDKRERASFLNLIGLMVQALRTKPGGMQSESAVIQRLLDMEMRTRSSPTKKLYGLSQRSLEKHFQGARESLEMAGILMADSSQTTKSHKN